MPDHRFGYGRERYWSLIAAGGIVELGADCSILEACTSILNPEELGGLRVSSITRPGRRPRRSVGSDRHYGASVVRR